MNSSENKRVFLVHWTYSQDEWLHFLRWNKMRKGLWHYFIHRIFSNKKLRTPEVAITNQKVWIGDTVQSFRDSEKQLKKIHIREAGNMNVMEIWFEMQAGKKIIPGDICIPIPKGKLREAMEVHESLSSFAW